MTLLSLTTLLWHVSCVSVHHILKLYVLLLLPKVLDVLLFNLCSLFHLIRHCTYISPNPDYKQYLLTRGTINSYPNATPHSTRPLPLYTHDEDDKTRDGLSTDARLTFDRSIFVDRYEAGSFGPSEIKFSPSKSALHAADLYVLYVLSGHHVRGRFTNSILSGCTPGTRSLKT